MATIAYKVLGQIAPGAMETSNTAYTVPAANTAIVSTINVCNQDTSNRAFSVAVVLSGENKSAPNTKNYIAYKTAIPSLDAISMTVGVTLGANDSIVVSSNGSYNLSYSIFGSEIY